MFRTFRRFFDNVNKKVWIIIFVILFVIFLVQMVNNSYKNKKDENTNIEKNSSITNSINNKISGTLQSSTSIIGGSNASQKTLEKETSVIDNFINYCNSAKIEEAYNLLTDECKEELFSDLEMFKNNYYNKLFNNSKTYKIQKWMENTYKLNIMDDILTTGRISSNESSYQEYITVIKNNSEYRLNINSFVEKKEVNKTKNYNGLEITIVSCNTYMEFSEYKITVKNTTGSTILLDNGNRTDTIYLLDDNGIKINANTGEIIYDYLKLTPGASRSYTFKFSNNYSTSRKMREFVFENIIMDNDEYENSENKYEYNNYLKFSLSL